MYKFILANEKNRQLQFNKVGGAFQITEIEGLSPVDATINTNSTALIDGGTFNSSKVNMRQLLINFTIETNPELNRQEVYKVLRPKKSVKIYYENNSLDVFSEGYVESVKVEHFASKQMCSVSILCTNPYWKTAQEIVNILQSTIPKFHFPFHSTEEPELVFGVIEPITSIVVDNNGNVDTGLTFELYARASVSDPKIYDYESGDFIGVNIEMKVGDLITINTTQGNKGVTLLRSGVETNIFNQLMKDITWLQLSSEGNAFTYTVDSGYTTNLSITIKHYDMYEGV